MSTRHRIRLPRWSVNTRGGRWVGGEKRRLYTFVDGFTGRAKVLPVYEARGSWNPNDGHSIRLATRAEAEGLVAGVSGWQHPLHRGWKVVD